MVDFVPVDLTIQPGRDPLLGDRRVLGSNRSELITGSRRSDNIQGRGGADLIISGSGDDNVTGQDGDDRILAGFGNDTVFGGRGEDSISGGQGDDILRGDAGNDTIRGAAGADRLYGGTGNDSLFGGAGNDRLVGGLGSDLMNGGVGDDLFVLNAAQQQIPGTMDIINGGTGFDRVQIVFNTVSEAEAFEDLRAMLGDTAAFAEFGFRVTGVELVEAVVVSNGPPIVDGALEVTISENQVRHRTNLITGVTNPDRGGLTIENFTVVSGDPSIVDVRGRYVRPNVELLQSLQFGETATFEATYDLVNAVGLRTTRTFRFEVLGRNDPVQAVDDGGMTELSVLEGTVLQFDAALLLQNDIDVDSNDFLEVVEVSAFSQFGAPIELVDGVIRYNPSRTLDVPEGQVVIDTFTYTVRDSFGATDTATVSIEVFGATESPQQAPVVVPIDETVSEDDGIVLLDLLGMSFDPDGDPLSFSNLALLSNLGSIQGLVGEIVGDMLSFDASLFEFLGDGESQIVDFSFDVSDGTFTIENLISILVLGANDEPVAVDDTGSIESDAVLVIDVIANDEDLDGDALEIIEIEGVSGNLVQIPTALGSFVTLNGLGDLVYDPTGVQNLAPGQQVVDTFTYTVSDGNGGTDTATVSITVTGQDRPTIDLALVNRFDPAENGSLHGGAISPDGMTIAVIGEFSTTIEFYARDGRLIGQIPMPGDNGNDGDIDFLTEPATLGGLDLPAGTLLVMSGDSGTADLFGLTPDVIDALLADPAANVDIPNIATDFGNSFIVGAAHHPLRDSYFLLTCRCDSDGNMLAEIDPATGLTIDQLDIGALGYSIFFGDIAVDPISGDLFLVSSDESEILHLTAEGVEVERIPLPDEISGLSGIGISRADGELIFALTSTTGVVFELRQDAMPNETPVAGDDVAETTAGLPVAIGIFDNDSDADGDPLSLIRIDGQDFTMGSVALASGATVTFDENSLELIYSPGSVVGTDSFTYSISDGALGETFATVTVNVTPEPNLPPEARPFGLGVPEGQGVFAVTLLDPFFVSDPEGDPLEVLELLQLSGPDVDFLLDGTDIILDSDQFIVLSEGESFFAEFSYLVSDGINAPVENQFTLSVTGVNDAPVFDDIVIATPISEDQQNVNIALDSGIDDPDVNDEFLLADLIQIAGRDTSFFLFDNVLTVEIAGFFDDLSAGETEILTFSYTVSDGTVSLPRNATVTITGENDPVAGVADAVTTDEDTALALSVDALLANDEDPDAADVLTIIAAGPEAATIGTVSFDGTTITYDPAGGFEFLAAGEEATDTFTYTVSDGNGSEEDVTVTVTVTGVNDPVTAVDDGPDTLAQLDVLEGVVLPIATADLLANDFDPDETDILTITDVTALSVLGATVSLSGGVITYDPGDLFEDLEDGETLVDSFTYTVEDGQGGLDTATVELLINGVTGNSAPMVQLISAEASEDSGIVSFDLLDPASVSDPNGDPLTASNLQQIQGISLGSVTLTDGELSFDTDEIQELGVEESVVLLFTYDVSDGAFTVQNSIEIAFFGGNDQVIGTPDFATTDEDTPLTLEAAELLANDFDPDTNDLLQVIAVAPNSGTIGTVSFDGTTVTYDPAGGFEFLSAGEEATDTFTYTVSDGNGSRQDVTVTVTVTGQNDGIEGTPDFATTDEDTALALDAAELLANDFDPDANDLLQIIAVSPDSNTIGTVSFDGTTVTYDPAGGFEFLSAGEEATDTFTYTVSDGNGSEQEVTVTVTVTGQNDGVEGTPDFATTDEDTALTLDVADLLANDFDPDTNDLLQIIAVAPDSGTIGTVSFDGTTVTYDPAGGFEFLSAGEEGTDTFTYTVSDGNGSEQDVTVTVTVTGQNDGVEGTPDFATTDEDTALALDAAELLANDFDPDAADILEIVAVAPDSGTIGTVSFDGTTVTYDPAGGFEFLSADEEATDTFTYTVSDGNGSEQDVTVTVTVTGQNDGVEGTPDFATTDEDTALALDASDLMANDFDPDAGDILEIVAVSPDSGTIGTVSFDGTTVTYDPAGGFEFLAAGEEATDTFTYTVSDGNGSEQDVTVTVTVTGQNDAPVAVVLTASTDEDTPVVLSGLQLVEDLEGEPVFLLPGDNRDGFADHVIDFQFFGPGAPLDPAAALGDADGNFVSLPGGASITLAFDEVIIDGEGADLLFVEEINSESARLEISADGITFVDLGVFVGTQAFDLADIAGIDVVTHVRITGVDNGGSSPGYDLDAVQALNFATPSGDVVLLPDGDLFYDPTGALDFLSVGETIEEFFTYTADDGSGDISLGLINVTVTGVNDPVDAIDDGGFVTGEATPLTIAASELLANDVDFDQSDLLEITDFAAVSELGVSLSFDGTAFTYDPTGLFDDLQDGESVFDSFTYEVSDGNGSSDIATVQIAVTGQGIALVGVSDQLQSGEDGFLDLDTNTLLLNDQGEELSVVAVDAVSALGAELVFSGGTGIDYLPSGLFDGLNEGETLADSFTYTVQDASGATATVTVNVEIIGDNDAPRDERSSRQLADVVEPEDETGTTLVDILDGFADPEGGALSIELLSLTSSNGARQVSGFVNGDGVLELDNASLQGLDEGETETLTVEFLVIDPDGASIEAIAAVDLIGVNDAPVLDPVVLTAETTEDSGIFTLDLAQAASDEETPELFFQNLTLLDGRRTLFAEGFEDDAAANGVPVGGSQLVPAGSGLLDQFQVTRGAVDLVNGTASGTGAALELDGSDLNGEIPAGSADPASTIETREVFDFRAGFEYQLLFALEGNASGMGTDTVAVQIGELLFENVEIAATDALQFFFFTFIPQFNQSATLSFTQTGPNDLNGAVLDIVSLIEMPVVTLNGSVLELDTDQFSDLSEGESRDLTFTYDVSDGALATQGEVQITVQGANDPVTGVADSFATDEDTALTITAAELLVNDSDPDLSDVLTISAVAGESANGVQIVFDGTTISYDPSGVFDGLSAGETVTDSFTYEVSDGNGSVDTVTVEVQVDGVNDPVTGVADSLATDEDTALAITAAELLANDSDPDLSDVLTISAVAGESANGVQIVFDGITVSYDPSGVFDGLSAGETVTDSFTYEVSDGNGSVDTVTVEVQVEGVNDPVTGVADSFATDEDTALTISAAELLANDSDPDLSDVLTISAVAGESANGVQIVFDGTTVSYDPSGVFDGLSAGETVTDSFTYEVSDGNGTVDTVTVEVQVDGVNDAPDFDDVTFFFSEDDGLVEINLSEILGSDVDGDALTAENLLQLSGGALEASLFDNGGETFLEFDTSVFNGLAEGEIETLIFQIDLTDGMASATGTFEIQISGENDAPQLIIDPVSINVDEGDRPVTVDLSATAFDPDGDPLTFALIDRLSIFTEDFRDEVAATGRSGDFQAQNFTGFDQFTVTAGSVDLQNDFQGVVSGPEIDLDGTNAQGSDNPAGQITSRPISLREGFTYELSFATRGSGEMLAVELGSAFATTVTVDHGFSTQEITTLTFTAVRDEEAALVFTNLEDNDNVGVFLSQIDLVEIGAAGTLDGSEFTFDPASVGDVPAGTSQTVAINYTVSDGTNTILGSIEATVTDPSGGISATDDFPGPPITDGLLITGESGGDLAGYAVSALGDINGDGIGDLLIGAPYASSAYGGFTGQSYVVFGSRNSTFSGRLELGTLDGSNGFAIDPLNETRFGQSVADVGDVNGDGVTDLLITAFGAPSEAPTSYLIFGDSDLGQNGRLEVTDSFLANGGGVAIVPDLAYAISSLNPAYGVGDLNGDGFDDFAIAYLDSEFPLGASGDNTDTLYVIFGAPDLGDGGVFNLSSVDGFNGFFIEAPDGAYTDFAGSVSAADINGDGFDDLIIGDREATGYAGTFGFGSAFVILGDLNLSANGYGDVGEFEIGNYDARYLDGSNGFLLSHSAGGGGYYSYYGYFGFGGGVDGGGDINGDGIEDVLVTNAFPDSSYYNTSTAGTGFIIFGDPGFGVDNGTFVDIARDNPPSNFFTFYSEQNFYLGEVEFAGDVNGDGFDDFLVATNRPVYDNYATDPGVTYLVFGSDSLSGFINLDQLDGTNGVILRDMSPSPEFGNPISAAGDLNGDGFDDILLGGPNFYSDGALQRGAVAVIFGGSRLDNLDSADGVLDGEIDLSFIGGSRNGFLTTDEQSVLRVSQQSLTFNDFIPGAEFILIDTIDAISASGASITFDGETVTYDPGDLFIGLNDGQSVFDTFEYTISSGGESATATVTVRINGIGEAPGLPATLELQTHRLDQTDVVGAAPGDGDLPSGTFFSASFSDGAELPAFLADAFDSSTGTFTLDPGDGAGAQGLYGITRLATTPTGEVTSVSYYLAVHDLEDIGGDGDDFLVTASSGGDSDLLIGGSGSDFLRGGDGSDIYVVRLGDGVDIISDNGFADADALLFDGADLSDYVFSRFLADGNDLLATSVSGDEVIVLDGLGGTVGFNIETFAFNGGVELGPDTIRAIITAAGTTEGDDRLIGFGDAVGDLLAGGLGDDTLIGGDGSDIYFYSLGDGDDVIEDNGFSDEDLLDIRGVSLADVRFERFGDDLDDLVIRFPDGGSIRIVNGLSRSVADTIESILFSGTGEVVTMDDIRVQILDELNNAEDATIIGFELDAGDTIEGGRGDDLLGGRDGSDLYIYSAGDGNDIIEDNGFADEDVLSISGFSLEGDGVVFRRGFNNDDLLIDLTSRTDATLDATLRLVNALNGASTDQIETVRIVDDGESLSIAELRERVIATEAEMGAESLTGFSSSADVLTASAETRFLRGSDGSDTYVIDVNDFSGVTINDAGFMDTDRIVIQGLDTSPIFRRGLGDPDDLFIDTGFGTIRVIDALLGNNASTIEEIVVEGVGTFDFDFYRMQLVVDQSTDGNDRIIGTEFTEFFGTLGGDDFIDLKGGSDFVSINPFGGSVVLQANADADFDQLVLSGISTDQISDIDGSVFATRSVSISIGEEQSLLLVNGRQTAVFEEVIFDDTSFDDAGFQAAIDESINLGRLIEGTTGDDEIVAEGSFDGDIALSGRGGNDVYVINADLASGNVGPGFTEIFDGGFSSADTLRIEGLRSAAVEFTFLASDLDGSSVLEEVDEGDIFVNIIETDQEILIHQGLLDGAGRIETFEFVLSDGSVEMLSIGDVRQQLVDSQTSIGSDTIIGFDGAQELLVTGEGEDVLRGFGGGDTYRIALTGRDLAVIADGSSSGGDVVDFGNIVLEARNFSRVAGDEDDLLITTDEGNEILIKDTLNNNLFSQIETILSGGRVAPASRTMADIRALLLDSEQTAGDDVIIGFDADDTFTGINANDIVVGGQGNDIFELSFREIGDVTIEGGQGAQDELILTGASEADLASFGQDPVNRNDLVLTFVTGGTVTLRNALNSSVLDSVDLITFGADGSTLTMQDVRERIFDAAQTSGAVSIVGFNTEDRITGNAADNFLAGGGALDTYVIEADGGVDLIREQGVTNGDTVILPYALSELIVSRSGSDGLNLLLEQRDTDDSVTILNGLRDSTSDRVEVFEFSDTQLTIDEIRQRIIDSQVDDGDNIIFGFGSDDTLTGAAGSDELIGGNGNDTYIFRIGDGADIINDSSNASNSDTLIFEGLDLNDVSFNPFNPGRDDVLFETVNGDQVLVINGLTGSSTQIEIFEFEDATVTAAELFDVAVTF